MLDLDTIGMHYETWRAGVEYTHEHFWADPAKFVGHIPADEHRRAERSVLDAIPDLFEEIDRLRHVLDVLANQRAWTNQGIRDYAAAAIGQIDMPACLTCGAEGFDLDGGRCQGYRAHYEAELNGSMDQGEAMP